MNTTPMDITAQLKEHLASIKKPTFLPCNPRPQFSESHNFSVQTKMFLD